MTSVETDRSHPWFCCRISCEDPSGDVVHREAPQAVIALACDPDEPLSLSLVQCDEIGPDGQRIIHDPEVSLTRGAGSVCLTKDEVAVMIQELGVLYAQLDEVSVPASRTVQEDG